MDFLDEMLSCLADSIGDPDPMQCRIIDYLFKQNVKMKEGLEEIRTFGYQNSDRGYTCARKCEDLLKEVKAIKP